MELKVSKVHPGVALLVCPAKGSGLQGVDWPIPEPSWRECTIDTSFLISKSKLSLGCVTVSVSPKVLHQFDHLDCDGGTCSGMLGK